MAVVKASTRSVPNRRNELFNTPMPVFDSISARDADALAQTLNDLSIRAEENFKQVTATIRGGIVTVELTDDGVVLMDASRSTTFVVPVAEGEEITLIDVINTDCGQVITITFENTTNQPLQINQWPPNVSGTDESLDLNINVGAKITFRFIVTGADCDELTLLSSSGQTNTKRIDCTPGHPLSYFPANPSDPADDPLLNFPNSWDVSEENGPFPPDNAGSSAFREIAPGVIQIQSCANFGLPVEFNTSWGIAMRAGTWAANQTIEVAYQNPITDSGAVPENSFALGIGVRLSGTFDNFTGYFMAFEHIGNGQAAGPDRVTLRDGFRIRLYKVQGGSTSDVDNGFVTTKERAGYTLIFDGDVKVTLSTYRLSCECDRIIGTRGLGAGQTEEQLFNVQDGDITSGRPGLVNAGHGGPIGATIDCRLISLLVPAPNTLTSRVITRGFIS